MYERFTDRARKVMALANQEAQRLNHKEVGSGDILLGLVKEGSGVGFTVLKNLGANLLKLRSEIEKRIKPSRDMVTMGKLPQTPAAKKVIEYTIEEARSLNHKYVGTEHLLLGLLRRQKTLDGKYRQTTAQKILRSLDITLKKAREEVLNLLGSGTELSKKEHKIKKVATKKKQGPVKCKVFELNAERITKFLETREFVQATQSSLNMPNGTHETKITIFYKDRE